MNYRHAYHAGNFADVVKHLVLCLVLAHLKRKEAPFRFIDTHAGRGLYDLAGTEATKTGEWREGIGRLFAPDLRLPTNVQDILAPYLELLDSDCITDEQGLARLARYPGSPLIARRMLRAQDRMVVNELHPEDREHLADLFHRDRQTKVMGLDGYTALKALLPPKERRGVVLVDPPFEVAGEFDRLAGAAAAAQRRFASVILVLWFPIKSSGEVERFYQELSEVGLAKALAIEFQVASQPEVGKALVAAGLVVVNPPHTLAEQMSAALPVLADVLETGAGSRWQVRWIVEETGAGRAN